MRKDYESKEKVINEQKTILIAPSWQEDNIVDSCLEDILQKLRATGYKVIVRPHPQHVRHMPEKMQLLKISLQKIRILKFRQIFLRTIQYLMQI